MFSKRMRLGKLICVNIQACLPILDFAGGVLRKVYRAGNAARRPATAAFASRESSR
jgi:hypothetical protein